MCANGLDIIFPEVKIESLGATYKIGWVLGPPSDFVTWVFVATIGRSWLLGWQVAAPGSLVWELPMGSGWEHLRTYLPYPTLAFGAGWLE